jgi:hypothetical protein
MKKIIVFLAIALFLLCAEHFVFAGTQEEVASDTKSPERQVLVMLHLPAPHFRPDADYAGGYGEDAGRQARRRVASELAREYGLTLVGQWPMPVLGVDCFVMQVPDKKSISRIADLLSHDARAEWAQPMGIFHTLGTLGTLGHNDPLYPVQPAAQRWHLADIHALATGRNVKVAVVDSGVEETHPDLLGQIDAKENFVDGMPYAGEAHGTGVAGIIAARVDDGVGIAGIAPAVRVLALRACWQESPAATRCTSLTLGKALDYAIAHHARVINLSLTGPSDRLLEHLLDAALARGIKIVGAVDPDHPADGFPASYPGVWRVSDGQSPSAAVNALIAPGRDIPTSAPGARWDFVSGSSYAAAHVSGLAALLTELRPSLAPAQIRDNIVTVKPASIGSGSGTIDACATIAWASGACACSCPPHHDRTASR